jgi:hypothetical protein
LVLEDVVGEANLGRLVDIQDIGAPVPAPRTGLCAVATVGKLYDFAGTILDEQPVHAAASRTAIEPYGEWGCLRIYTRLKEPKEGIDRVVLLIRLKRKGRKVDVARVLRLVFEDGRAGAGLRLLVGYGDVRIDR